MSLTLEIWTYSLTHSLTHSLTPTRNVFSEDRCLYLDEKENKTTTDLTTSNSSNEKSHKKINAYLKHGWYMEISLFLFWLMSFFFSSSKKTKARNFTKYRRETPLLHTLTLSHKCLKSFDSRKFSCLISLFYYRELRFYYTKLLGTLEDLVSSFVRLELLSALRCNEFYILLAQRLTFL